MYNVILFTDAPEFATRTRGYGVHRLASHIRERGYSCLVVDFMSGLTINDFKKIIDYAVGVNTYMVGISVTWLPYRYTLLGGEGNLTSHDPGRDIVKEDIDIHISGNTSMFSDKMQVAIATNKVEPWLSYIKEKNSKIKLCLGGTKIGMYLDIKMIDHLFIGYSETMVIDFLDSVSGKSPKRIWNKIIDYDQKAQAPVWDFKLSQTRYTEHDFIQQQEPLSLEVGRGCRFKCKFCSYPLIGMKDINSYIKPIEVLVDELQRNYDMFGTTRYFIIDDTFNDSTEKMKMFLEVTNRLPFKISFWCYLRADLLVAHPEQIPMLLEMGLAQCYFGIETFNHRAGKVVGKGGNPDKLKETLYKCKEIWGKNVNIQAGFMVGLPYEDSASIMETAKWLSNKDCPVDIKWIFPLNIASSDSEVMKYTYRSDFDRNAEKYGYTIPDPKIFWEWTKNDGTDINSSQQAEQVAIQAEKTIKSALYQGCLYQASLPHPVLSDRTKTLAMESREYERLINEIDKPLLYLKTVKEDYFDLLIDYLKKLQSS
jgi:hypothetical protein